MYKYIIKGNTICALKILKFWVIPVIEMQYYLILKSQRRDVKHGKTDR